MTTRDKRTNVVVHYPLGDASNPQELETYLDSIDTSVAAKIGGSTGATDNRLLRADGTGGKTLQNSALTCDDSGNVSGVVNQTMTGYADLSEISAPGSPAAGVLRLYALTTGLATKTSAGVERLLYQASPTVQVFTANGTWTKPTGCQAVLAFATGPGGTGGTDNAGGFGAAGGGGGSTGIKRIDVSAITSVTVTIPAAGSGSATTFGAHISAGAGANASGTTPGAGGTSTGGDINIRGQTGFNPSFTNSGPGGGSFWGGGAGNQHTDAVGIAAIVYGAGGSGGNSNGGGSSRAGGAGMPGVVVVIEFY